MMPPCRGPLTAVNPTACRHVPDRARQRLAAAGRCPSDRQRMPVREPAPGGTGAYQLRVDACEHVARDQSDARGAALSHRHQAVGRACRRPDPSRCACAHLQLAHLRHALLSTDPVHSPTIASRRMGTRLMCIGPQCAIIQLLDDAAQARPLHSRINGARSARHSRGVRCAPQRAYAHPRGCRPWAPSRD